MNTCSVLARRFVALAAALALTTACSGEDGIPLELRGDDGDGEFVPVDYELTSDTYRKWVVAQESLARDAGDADLGLPAQRVVLTNPTAGSIDSVVDQLESTEQTRDAIRSAGLSVKDYVLATLALYQATDRPDTLGLTPGGVPIRTGNVELARTNAEQISAARASSPVRFVDDRPRARGNGKGKGGKGKGRGKGKG
ncbi:MAG TPA: hypothetical protein VMY38_02910 [Gemmatimonadaceae bacterium]|nr:hypothetical protein [Gemmatimonadaceae bacterium]